MLLQGQWKATGGFKLENDLVLIFVFKRAPCLLCEEHMQGQEQKQGG